MRGVALLALALLTAAPAGAYCPSYTLSSASNDHRCGIEAVEGKNPTVAEWQTIFALVSRGPAAWGRAGPSVGTLTRGCSKPKRPSAVPATFPCELLKAIAMQESSWKQFCPVDQPRDQADGKSRTLISFDCGYGVGQVTSGMHIGESPAFDRARVASDPTYNLATGTLILREKWQYPRCVGDKQPDILEHWYTAVWAYNGLAYKNNPSNPVYSSTRGVYRPSVGGAYPYQEKVFGWMEYPPTDSHWPKVAVAYPPLGTTGSGGTPPNLDEPRCASPTDCARQRPVHRSACLPPLTDGGTPDAGDVTVDPEPDPGADEKEDPYPDGGGGHLPSPGAEAAALDWVRGETAGLGCSATAVRPAAWPWLLLGAAALTRKLRRRGRRRDTEGSPSPSCLRR